MSKGKCSVLGCLIPTRPMHSFPNPNTNLKRFKLWLSATGDVLLRSKEAKQVYISNRICHKHFDVKYYAPNNRLSKDAFPTLHLPEAVEVHDVSVPVKTPPKAIDLPTSASATSLVALTLPSDMPLSHTISLEHSPRMRVTPLKRKFVQTKSPQRELVKLSLLDVPSTSTGITSTSEVDECTTNIVFKEKEASTTSTTVISLKKARQSLFSSKVSLHTSHRRSPSLTRRSILGIVGVNYQANLTPKKKLLYKEIINIRKQANNWKRKSVSLKSRFLYVQKLLQNRKCTAFNSLDPAVARFCESQLQNINKPKKGRVYSLDDKIFALTLYKQSPKAYKIMSNMFSLPSIETLRKILRHVPITPGISEPIFNNLKLRVQAPTFGEKNKCCILMFDEMSLQPHLFYSKHQDIVEGFQDCGLHRTPLIADHAMVWMLRGIYKKWKQPVAYSFCKSTTSAPDIVRTFKEIVKSAAAAGLNIIASVCDQGATNVRAIKMLLQETKADALRRGVEERNDVIKVNNITVIPLFDPPHLLKAVRNNFLTKDLQFTINGTTKVAKWSHIVDAYFIDVASGDLRLMPKLSEFHVLPTKLRKMKVSICAQVFSRSVAAGINEFAISRRHTPDGNKVMSKDALNTVDIIKFFDQLFDSVNGGIGFKKLGKPLRNLTTTLGNSRQKSLWDRAIPIINSMEFLRRRPNDRTKPEVLKNWVFTLRGFSLISSRLRELGFTAFATRVFNQDPLENFFGQVRQYGLRNINPTCAAFGPYFKTLLINNFATVHSAGSNCEKDKSIGPLIALKLFVTQGVAEPVSIIEHFIPPHLPATADLNRPFQIDALNYISGYIAKNIKSKYKNCSICSFNILNQGERTVSDQFLKLKEYDQANLTYCNESFRGSLLKVYNCISWYLPQIIHEQHCGYKLQLFLKKNVQFEFKICEHTDTLQNDITNNFTNLVIFNYCKILNKILSGKETPRADADQLEKSVYTNYLKRLKK